MTIKEIQAYMTKIHQAINGKFGKKPKEEAILGCMVKLSEEAGELAE